MGLSDFSIHSRNFPCAVRMSLQCVNPGAFVSTAGTPLPAEMEIQIRATEMQQGKGNVCGLKGSRQAFS